MATTKTSRHNCEQKCGRRGTGPWPPGVLPPGRRTDRAGTPALGHFPPPPRLPPPAVRLASASRSSA
eukprot:9105318-Pyramimonas_sp.AAC.1